MNLKATRTTKIIKTTKNKYLELNKKAKLIYLVFLLLLASYSSYASILKTEQNNYENNISKNSVINRAKFKLQFSKNYEFIFFYSNSCLYCKNFEPIFKKYSDSFGIGVRGFVINGDIPKSSSYFPNSSVVSQEMIAQFFGRKSNISVPTLFIMNKNNLHVYPVSQGALTYSELVKRMSKLKPKILHHETGLINKYSRNIP